MCIFVWKCVHPLTQTVSSFIQNRLLFCHSFSFSSEWHKTEVFGKKWRGVAWRRRCSWKFPSSEWLSLFEWSLTWRFMLFLNLKLKTVTLKRNKRQTCDLFLGRFGPIFLKKHFENVIRKQCACMTLLNWNKIFKNGNCLRILR